jgi:hypothetical protein
MSIGEFFASFFRLCPFSQYPPTLGFVQPHVAIRNKRHYAPDRFPERGVFVGEFLTARGQDVFLSDARARQKQIR